MTEQQYRVTADRDKGDDPDHDDVREGDRVTTVAVVEGTIQTGRVLRARIDRIERPVVKCEHGRIVFYVEDNETRCVKCGVVISDGQPVERPPVPTREQIADYSELRADLATMARQERTPDHWAIGRNQRTARSALSAIDTLLALLNGADR